MDYYSKSVVLAGLVCVSIAFVLKYDPVVMTKGLQTLKADIKDVMKLVMQPHIPSRYIPDEAYLKMGLNAATRLKSYRWDNCGKKSNENFIVHDILFQPDPLIFPGPLVVSFDVSLNVTSSMNLQASVLIAKKIGGMWIKVPCVGQIGSCTYDLCTELQQLPSCPPDFERIGIDCKCPFRKGSYKLTSEQFQVNAPFLPSGDYHLRANITDGKLDGGCYDIYVSFVNP